MDLVGNHVMQFLVINDTDVDICRKSSSSPAVVHHLLTGILEAVMLHCILNVASFSPRKAEPSAICRGERLLPPSDSMNWPTVILDGNA